MSSASGSGDVVDANGCRDLDVDFIMLEGDATLAAIEKDIVANLREINVKVKTRKLQKEAFNTAMTSGDFNLAFSETYGAPYDPHG